MEDVVLCKKPISLNKNYFEKQLKPQGKKMNFKDDSSFWVDVKGRNDKGQVESNGKVRLLLDVMPFGYAE